MIFKGNPTAITRQVRGAIASSLVAFNTGCLVGLPGTLIPQLETEDSSHLRIDFTQASWIASIYLIAGLPASLIGGYLSTLYGRRGLTLAICFPLLASWVILATSDSLTQVLVARLLSALSVSLAHPSMGVFVSEISHPDLRGTFGAFPSIFLALGITYIYLLGWQLPWRSACWLCTVCPLILFLSFWFIPESPYWLLHRGRSSSAWDSLQWYRGEEEDVSKEFDEIVGKQQSHADQKPTGTKPPPGRPEELKPTMLKNFLSKLKVLTTKRFLKPFSISGVIYILAQWTGVSTLVFYMTHIFRESGSNIDPAMAPVAVAGIRVLAASFSSIILSFASRRHLFCACSIMIAISAFSLAMSAKYLDSSAVPMTAIISMFIGHSIGVVPICQLISAEVFPTEIRTLGTGICVALATLANALNAEFYHRILQLVGFSVTFWIYAGVAVIMAVHGWCVLPDTRHMSLAKIESQLYGESAEETSADTGISRAKKVSTTDSGISLLGHCYSVSEPDISSVKCDYSRERSCCKPQAFSVSESCLLTKLHEYQLLSDPLSTDRTRTDTQSESKLTGKATLTESKMSGFYSASNSFDSKLSGGCKSRSSLTLDSLTQAESKLSTSSSLSFQSKSQLFETEAKLNCCEFSEKDNTAPPIDGSPEELREF